MSFYADLGYDKILDYAKARHTVLEIELSVITRAYDHVQPLDPNFYKNEEGDDNFLAGLKQAVMLHQHAIETLEAQLNTRAAYAKEPINKKIDLETAIDEKIAQTYLDLIKSEASFYNITENYGYFGDEDYEVSEIAQFVFGANLAAGTLSS